MKTHCSIVQTGLCLSVALTFGTGIESVSAQPNVSEFQRFADWCEHKDSLTPEARHTVEVLLENAGMQECEKADEMLSNLTELDLGYNQIADVQPLSALTNLTELDLRGNPLSDRTCPLQPASICDLKPLE